MAIRSVALSLANLAANAHCLIRLLGAVGISHPASDLFRISYLGQAVGGLFKGSNGQRTTGQRKKLTRAWLWALHFALAVNAWTWSSVRSQDSISD
jgi:hypothetical protein